MIELIIVLVLLGVLGAVAVPRFIDLSDEADHAAVTTQAAAITAGSAINFAAKVAGDASAINTAGENCADVAPLLLQGDSVDPRFTVNGTVSPTEGDSSNCTVTSTADPTITATAQVIAVEVQDEET